MARLKTYNGWSGEVRAQRYAELKAAQRAGQAPVRPGPCEICRQSQGTMWHAEQYGPTFADYLAQLHALCAYCHGMLHLRFQFPNRWRRHLLNATEGPTTFMASMGAVFAYARRVKYDCDRPAPADCELLKRGRAWFYHLSMKR